MQLLFTELLLLLLLLLRLQLLLLLLLLLQVLLLLLLLQLLLLPLLLLSALLLLQCLLLLLLVLLLLSTLLLERLFCEGAKHVARGLYAERDRPVGRRFASDWLCHNRFGRGCRGRRGAHRCRLLGLVLVLAAFVRGAGG